ncbi:hypothetical protein Tco_0590768 [Tanacetum coccineum]
MPATPSPRSENNISSWNWCSGGDGVRMVAWCSGDDGGGAVVVTWGWYGYIKNHKKTVKNGQARTRESEEYKKKPKIQSRSQKSQTRSQIHYQGKSRGNLKLKGDYVYSRAPNHNGKVNSVISMDYSSSLSSSRHVEMEKAHILVGFCTKLLTKEAQTVTSRNDSLAILKCPHSIQRPIFVIQSLKEMKG